MVPRKTTTSDSTLPPAPRPRPDPSSSSTARSRRPAAAPRTPSGSHRNRPLLRMQDGPAHLPAVRLRCGGQGRHRRLQHLLDRRLRDWRLRDRRLRLVRLRTAGLRLRTEAASLLPAARGRDPERLRLLDSRSEPLLHMRPADLCDLRRDGLAVQQWLLVIELQLCGRSAADVPDPRSPESGPVAGLPFEHVQHLQHVQQVQHLQQHLCGAGDHQRRVQRGSARCG